MMRLFKRRAKFDVVQVQDGKVVVVLESGVSRDAAYRTATYVNGRLALYKALDPYGPQDVHAAVRDRVLSAGIGEAE